VKQVINVQDRVVLVDFYADWCNPCKMLSPVLEKLTSGDDATSGSGLPLDLVTVDTDAQTELAMEYKIRSLPTVIAFQNGKPVSQFMGAMPEGSVRNFISKL
jgi:thioredoxin 1